MKFRIGVDFDNTIACYDQVFFNVVRMLGLLDAESELSKAEVQKSILLQPGGDLVWQKLQGQVYGKYMHLAVLFPGFVEFLCLSKLKGHSVFVVSHKSEYGHFDEDRVSLRDAAINWMQANKLLGPEVLALTRDEVFFEPTRESKINRIRTLGCTHFIDDLKEVFEEAAFPMDTEKLLFDPRFTSWRGIQQRFYGDWSEAEVCLVVQSRFPTLNVRQASLVKGRGNSRIFKLTGANEEQYALKIYPDRQLDERPRLETEFSACKSLVAAGFPVTRALAKDEQLNWAVYAWVFGAAIQSPGQNYIDEAESFIKHLLVEGRSSNNFADFPAASEACLSGAEIERQIRERFARLEQVDSDELCCFLKGEFLPIFEFFVQTAQNCVHALFKSPLPRSLQILSPSDFGAHNTIEDESGQSVFIDFEYFGWDDPVKLVCDFYFHPGMNLSEDLKERWIQHSKVIFQKDFSFDTRLTAYLPLYGLRWCLILLNEFLPNRLSQRIHANNVKSSDVKATLLAQLDKSRSLLTQIVNTHTDAVVISAKLGTQAPFKDRGTDHGSAIQAA